MDLAWEKKELTVKKAQFYLGSKHQLAYTTLLTVLTRLSEKGHLIKEKRGRVFVFKPTESRSGFISSRVELIRENLYRNFPHEFSNRD